MPMPKPQSDEEHDAFMDRCMADPAMMGEYEGDDERYAVCQQQWDETQPRSRTAAMERRFLPQTVAELRMEQREERQIITGYAAVYYDGSAATQCELWAGACERIMPGAFDRALADRHDARALFNHDPNLLLARRGAGTLRLRADQRGLVYEIEPPETTTGRDVAALIGRGDLYGSSFAFRLRPEDESWRQEGKMDIREIRSMDLFDVSPVTFPAYEASSVGLRAFGEAGDARASWNHWQQARAAEADKLASAARCRRLRIADLI